MASGIQMAPHSIEAEEAVLGAVLLNPDALSEVASRIQPEDFYIVRHAWLFEALLYLDDQREPIDLTTVVAELEARGRLEEVGGAAYVLNLINNTPTAMHAGGYARIVQRKAKRRRVIAAASQAVNAAHDEDMHIDEVTQVSATAMLDATEGTDETGQPAKLQVLSQVVSDEADDWQNNPADIRGIQTYTGTLDEMTGGIDEPIYAGLPGLTGGGKSTLARQIAVARALAGKTTFYFSHEESEADAVRAMAVALAKVEWRKVRRGQLTPAETERYFAALNRIHGLSDRLLIFDQSAVKPNFNDIKRAILSHRYNTPWADDGDGLVIIDTLDVARNTYGSAGRYESVTAYSASLLGLPHTTGMMVLALKQLNRANVTRDDKRPTRADMADARVDEHMRLILGLFRPSGYWPRVGDAPTKEHEYWGIRNKEGGYTQKVIDLGSKLALEIEPGDYAINDLAAQAIWARSAEALIVKRNWGGPGDNAARARLVWRSKFPGYYPLTDARYMPQPHAGLAMPKMPEWL
jgi:replicative DNA helicase